VMATPSLNGKTHEEGTPGIQEPVPVHAARLNKGSSWVKADLLQMH